MRIVCRDQVNDAWKKRLGDIIEIFKIITGRENDDKHQFFEFSNNMESDRSQIQVFHISQETPACWTPSPAQLAASSKSPDWGLY